MRKLLLILIMLCYVGSTTGIAMQYHFCMGELKSVSVHQEEHDDVCNLCGMDKDKNDCCKDEVDIVKVSDSHQQTGKYQVADLSWHIIPPASYYILPDVVEKDLSSYLIPKTNAPPIHSNISDWNAFYCIFRC